MAIATQSLKFEINRELARETNIWRSKLILEFQNLQRRTQKVINQFETYPSPTNRINVFIAIGQLQGYLACRDALKYRLTGDNTINRARGLIMKLSKLVSIDGGK